MTELKSTIPDDPTGLLRTQYKFISSDGNYSILVDYVIESDDISYANWSLYSNDKEDSSPAILNDKILATGF
jgi:hypothetical protein